MAKPRTLIALICPGGPISKDLTAKIDDIAAAKARGAAELFFHPQCFLEKGHFAGTDEERSAAFLEAANAPQFDAVWFARGGYGACRLDPGLYDKLNDAARAKTYLGYSDAGFILAKLYKEKIGRPAHGPMASDLPRQGGEAAIARALDFLTGRKGGGILEPSLDPKTPHVAFNITVLAHMIASDAMPDLSGHILMLEDVGEYLYRTDRALSAILTSPMAKKLAGVRLGRLSEIPENDRPFGQTEEEIARFWCARAGVPYLGRADIGHDSANKIVPFGRMRF